MAKFQFFRVHGQNPIEKSHLGRIGGSIEPLVGIFNLIPVGQGREARQGARIYCESQPIAGRA